VRPNDEREDEAGIIHLWNRHDQAELCVWRGGVFSNHDRAGLRAVDALAHDLLGRRHGCRSRRVVGLVGPDVGDQMECGQAPVRSTRNAAASVALAKTA
jgi:hypothetical protein